jgi:hypothetical protein
MSGMSSILGIHPGRPRLVAQRAEMKWETAFGDIGVPSGRSLFHFGSWREVTSR